MLSGQVKMNMSIILEVCWAQSQSKKQLVLDDASALKICTILKQIGSLGEINVDKHQP